MNRQILAALALAAGLAACDRTETAEAPAQATAATPAAAPAQRAVALLRGADGDMAGAATVVAADGGLTITIAAEALPVGVHGVHIHSVGKCEGPKFESAGPHWNPMAVKHGLENPDGQHAGDMPNLTAGADGRGVLEYALIASSLDALLDADGAAFVVHAKADDQKTDPSGDSGDRIACGVFIRG